VFEGVIIFSLLVLVFLYLYFSGNIFSSEYISFCTLFFLLGLVDDLKISIAPKFRLLIMIAFLVTLVIFNEIYIKKTGLEFLDNLVEIDIFSLMFICLCFLFIVNGSNLIDGFNGLLGIHSLIIFIVLFAINLINENNDLIYILFYVSLLNLRKVKINKLT
jgi:UDP-N-acetylmuramyl pentapeptide phosphotransferase/UDP-N-acetylglucosamine-1-phosphate transferase